MKGTKQIRTSRQSVYIVSGQSIVARELARIVAREPKLRSIIAQELPQIASDSPVVFILDTTGLRTSWNRLLHEIAARYNHAGIVVISSDFADTPPFGEMSQLGVHAWLPQADVSSRLVPSTLAAACGMCCVPLPATATKQIVEPHLSTRESQVYGLLRRRFSDREIAESLGVRVNTAKSYVSSVFRKAGVRHRRDLASDRILPN